MLVLLFSSDWYKHTPHTEKRNLEKEVLTTTKITNISSFLSVIEWNKSNRTNNCDRDHFKCFQNIRQNINNTQSKPTQVFFFFQKSVHALKKEQDQPVPTAATKLLFYTIKRIKNKRENKSDKFNVNLISWTKWSSVIWIKRILFVVPAINGTDCVAIIEHKSIKLKPSHQSVTAFLCRHFTFDHPRKERHKKAQSIACASSSESKKQICVVVSTVINKRIHSTSI